MNEIIIKKANKDILKELGSIGFDKAYLSEAKEKYIGEKYKIFNLKPYEANILKQTCLSLGFDCAVNRDTITCKCETTDCLIFATRSQYKKLVQKLKNQPFRLKKTAEKLNELLTYKIEPIKIRNYSFDFKRPYIMGILNVTPDSFSDGGKYNNPKKAFEYCIQMINEGADIIDIGGESTRPSAKPVTIDVETDRIIPVIEEIRKNNIDIPISVDTRNFKTAKTAIEAGADIINDVSGLDYDELMFDYVSKNNIPVVIMHSDKVPAVSSNFTKGDIVEDVYKSLEEKIEKLVNAGMERKNIIADVGIGFGKSQEGNFELLKRMQEFSSLMVPILSGISRKSFIRNSFNITADEADIPTAFYSAMLTSVNIHRVHNVALTKKFLNYASLIKS